jgi:hypothetical protein
MILHISYMYPYFNYVISAHGDGHTEANCMKHAHHYYYEDYIKKFICRSLIRWFICSLSYPLCEQARFHCDSQHNKSISESMASLTYMTFIMVIEGLLLRRLVYCHHLSESQSVSQNGNWKVIPVPDGRSMRAITLGC